MRYTRLVYIGNTLVYNFVYDQFQYVLLYYKWGVYAPFAFDGTFSPQYS